jgi:phenylpropionate dioxygenase-like ring-hydroxylating dioxygenase large terminal subunit
MRWEEGWYVLAESRRVKTRKALPCRLLGSPLELFRDRDGRATALDRAEVREQEGYVYGRLERGRGAEPFRLPHVGERGWARVRLVHGFRNSVVNCAENFIDVPHTAFVHRGLFRSSRREALEAAVVRARGRVEVEYRGEGGNLGLFRWFLNPSGGAIGHRDTFVLPNVTQVEYRFGPRRRFYITSQGVPLQGRGEAPRTLVYTDLCWNYGPWTRLCAPMVWLHAKAIIAQDQGVLEDQGRQLERGPAVFRPTEADAHHLLVESLVREMEAGGDPLALPERRLTMRFWV